MQIKKKLRAAVAVLSATVLAGTPLLLSPIGATASAARVTTSQAAMPHVVATMGKKSITMTGMKGLRPGRVTFSVKGAAAVEFALFAPGYDVTEFVADMNKFGAKNDIKALRHTLKNAQFLGGVAPGGSGTVVLPRAGTYAPFGFGARGVIVGKAFTLTGPARSSSTPRTDGAIIAKSGPAWGGASHLPMKGRFLFKNKANTGVPHFVILQQVAEGTTTDEVLENLQTSDESSPPPPWALPAGMETGSLSPGRSMTVDYDLPAGQYVVMCFFPDPKMGGMPHALMGMLEMIHLM